MILLSLKLLYLDPGTGSFVFQAISAAGAILAVGYKNIIGFIKKIFNKKNV